MAISRNNQLLVEKLCVQPQFVTACARLFTCCMVVGGRWPRVASAPHGEFIASTISWFRERFMLCIFMNNLWGKVCCRSFGCSSFHPPWYKICIYMSGAGSFNQVQGPRIILLLYGGMAGWLTCLVDIDAGGYSRYAATNTICWMVLESPFSMVISECSVRKMCHVLFLEDSRITWVMTLWLRVFNICEFAIGNLKTWSTKNWDQKILSKCFSDLWAENGPLLVPTDLDI